MGKIEDENIEKKLDEIKDTLQSIGMSRPKFASRYTIDTSEYDIDEDELKRAVARICQHLKRGIKNHKLLDTYLNYIKNTPEYKNSGLADIGSTELNLEEILTEIQPSIEIEHKTQKNEVLNIAKAYAQSIGSAWNFQVILLGTNDLGERYLVIWEGDIGHNHGSGTWGAAMCEIQESHFGSYYVDIAEHHFKTSLRRVDRVVGYENEILSLIGSRYGERDANNHPSLVYKVTLKKNQEQKWLLESEEFIEDKHQTSESISRTVVR